MSRADDLRYLGVHAEHDDRYRTTGRYYLMLATETGRTRKAFLTRRDLAHLLAEAAALNLKLALREASE